MSLNQQVWDLLGNHYKVEDPIINTIFINKDGVYANGLRSIEHASSDFSNPDDQYDFTDTCLFADNDGFCQVVIGDLIWETTAGVGASVLFSGQNISTTAGEVRFKVGSGKVWTDFLAITSQVVNIALPQAADNDGSGGSFNVRFIPEAISYAFKDQDDDIILRLDGSIYKGEVALLNLVIDGTTGDIGPSGRDAVSSDFYSGSWANELNYAKLYHEQLTRFWDINEAPGEFLDTLGEDWLGIPRAPGESDRFYLQRIKATLTASKNTPYGLELILQNFSDFILIQEGLAGFGSITRSFLGRYTDGSAGYDITHTQAATTSVSAISTTVTPNDTFTVSNVSEYAIGDEIWHDDGTNPVKQYVVANISGSDIIIQNEGYDSSDNFVSGIIAITGNPTGNIIKYDNAVIQKFYLGSVTEGVLQIRITLEANEFTTNPVTAKFIVDLIENSVIPGAKVTFIIV